MKTDPVELNNLRAENNELKAINAVLRDLRDTNQQKIRKLEKQVASQQTDLNKYIEVTGSDVYPKFNLGPK